MVSELRYKVLADRPPLDPVQELLLDKERLLEWSELKKEAREFIQQHEGDIPLRGTACQHRDLVLDLYSWIFRKGGALYLKQSSLLEEFDKKIWTLHESGGRTAPTRLDTRRPRS